MKLHAQIERIALKAPFRITGRTYEVVDVLVATVERDGQVGRGEARGVHYRNDGPASMMRQIEALWPTIEAELLPPGGARNALDCALWDLEAKLSGRCAWQIAGLEKLRPVLTVLTCGADEPDQMAATARGYKDARAIKLKLTGKSVDADRVRAVREARQDVWLSVDANRGFDRAFLERLMPVLVDARVSLIEQPYPIGQEALLDGFQSPIAIAADESVRGLADLPGLVGRFGAVNIKLDKCGGLTEGLAMVRAARSLGLDIMVGNMIGTSLAMAPGFLVGQLCKVVDLDGPIFLKTDRAITVDYTGGFISCPEALWGNASTSQ